MHAFELVKIDNSVRVRKKRKSDIVQLHTSIVKITFKLYCKMRTLTVLLSFRTQVLRLVSIRRSALFFVGKQHNTRATQELYDQFKKSKAATNCRSISCFSLLINVKLVFFFK